MPMDNGREVEIAGPPTIGREEGDGTGIGMHTGKMIESEFGAERSTGISMEQLSVVVILGIDN